MATANPFLSDHPIYRGYESVKDILSAIEGRGYIAGSYAAYMGTEDGTASVVPGDIDIFATNDENAKSILASLCNGGAGRSFDVAIWEHTGNVWKISRSGDLLPIQIIAPDPTWTTFPDDIVNNFDFDICRAIVVPVSNGMVASAVYMNSGATPEQTYPYYVIGDTSLGSKQGKVLRVNDPLRTLKRLHKYMARGIEFSDHELYKVFRAWDDMSSSAKLRKLFEARDEDRGQAGSVDREQYVGDGDWFDGE